MALSSESESVLESAMKKITGEPGASATSNWRPAQYLPENVIGYSDEFGGRGSLGTVTGPVASPATPSGTINVSAPASNLYNQTRYHATEGQRTPTLEVGTIGGSYIPVSNSNLYDPEVKAQLDRSLAEQKTSTNPYLGFATDYISSLYNQKKPGAASVTRSLQPNPLAA
jgi:hypothetical protein